MKSHNNEFRITRPAPNAMQEFGRQLRQRRKQWGMSQAGLAKKGGTIQATIANIEAGKANPTMRTLEGIAHALQQELTVGFRRKRG